MGGLKTANLTLSFLLELAMVAPVVFWGLAAHQSVTGRILAGVVLPIVLVVFWALFLDGGARPGR